jgi:hypothetical protein
MAMDGLDGLNTVGMWVETPRAFPSGSSFECDCCVLNDKAIRGVIDTGVAFRLWDGGFIADGRVITVYQDSWKEPAEPGSGGNR